MTTRPEQANGLSDDECTTADMLRKLARLFTKGELSFALVETDNDKEWFRQEWIRELGRRADLLDNADPAPPSPAEPIVAMHYFPGPPERELPDSPGIWTRRAGAADEYTLVVRRNADEDGNVISGPLLCSGWCGPTSILCSTANLPHHHWNRVPPEPAEVAALRERAEHERNRLADGIATIAKAAGIIDGTQPLTGPQLLMLCDDVCKEIVRVREQAEEYGQHLSASNERAKERRAKLTAAEAALSAMTKERDLYHKANCSATRIANDLKEQLAASRERERVLRVAWQRMSGFVISESCGPDRRYRITIDYPSLEKLQDAYQAMHDIAAVFFAATAAGQGESATPPATQENEDENRS